MSRFSIVQSLSTASNGSVIRITQGFLAGRGHVALCTASSCSVPPQQVPRLFFSSNKSGFFSKRQQRRKGAHNHEGNKATAAASIPELRIDGKGDIIREQPKRREHVHLPEVQFQEAAKHLLDRVSSAVRPMASQNKPPFQVSVNANDGPTLTIDMGAEKGAYYLKVVEDHQEVMLTSPMSGAIMYFFSPENGRWLGVNDNHDMEGLITRDMIHQGCLGYPKF
eukprot:CAMPEP_0113944582 /NCGR_PEP_ID=MMETSP1339-20121228/34650_1 /TAXON_ID=94617 /ORGANISM="Fibrocapsa japonica" /LENGTH=222 /DNA_ID=CAMNT_0000949831 /DNA_START=142 /DNA_END=810 /DNA_ORIENTATION=+ /assembly_acc=CAM_ASM_000762